MQYTRDDYYGLEARLSEIETRLIAERGLYVGLYDENVDRENCGPESAPDFWDQMTRAAMMAAGLRAEDAGLDINDLMGRVIY